MKHFHSLITLIHLIIYTNLINSFITNGQFLEQFIPLVDFLFAYDYSFYLSIEITSFKQKAGRYFYN